MKTKFNLLCIITVMMLGFSFKAKSQTYPLTNSLTCDVTIFYEIWKNTPPNCAVCSSGSITVPAGTTVNLNPCNGFTDICIIILDINGTPIASNHSTLFVCHLVTPSGQSGTNPMGCFNGTSWTASQSGTGWVIW